MSEEDKRYKDAIEALHELACHDGHNAARNAIAEWQEEYTDESYTQLIKELGECLSDRQIRMPE